MTDNMQGLSIYFSMFSLRRNGIDISNKKHRVFYLIFKVVMASVVNM